MLTAMPNCSKSEYGNESSINRYEVGDDSVDGAHVQGGSQTTVVRHSLLYSSAKGGH